MRRFNVGLSHVEIVSKKKKTYNVMDNTGK